MTPVGGNSFCALRFLWLMAAALAVYGCASDAPSSYLDKPRGPLPETMTSLGLYPALARADLNEVHAAVRPYRPGLELWSNGSDKQRFIYVPSGQKIDTTSREGWGFPTGTLFFKTFAYPDSQHPTGSKPVETRLLQRTPEGWQYAVYLWNASGTEATLWDPARTVAVPVKFAQMAFDHVVPAKLDCRKCHESQPNAVIGFDELRLNEPMSLDVQPGSARTQLEELSAAGLFKQPLPAQPASIHHPDVRTQRVLAYLQGNCVHCHNGSDGPSASFDLRPGVALTNLIGRPTEGEALAGIRVVPGRPQESALYLAMTRDESLRDIQPMPPVGVERRDDEALELFRTWIEGLASSEP